MRALVSVGSLLLLAACAAADPPDPTPRVRQGITRCVPNQTLVCVCGLDQGSQRCTESGELTPCVCPTKDGSAPADSPSCGDGTVDPGEACDDGNTGSYDGCSPKCLPDGEPAAGEKCPGQPLALWKGASFVLWGTTTGHTDDVSLDCRTAGPDRVYAIRPRAAGQMLIQGTFAPGFDARLAVRADHCGEGGVELSCADARDAALGRRFDVDPRRTYYVIVDGASKDAMGTYAIRVELP